MRPTPSLISPRFGTYSTSEAIIAGQDLEMPGPTRWRGGALMHAVTSNKVKENVLDDRVRAVLNTVKLAANSGVVEASKEEKLNRPEDKILLRRVAAESLVLLKNNGNSLPFDKNKTVAVIGPNAKFAAYAGGGSASLQPYYTVTPLEGVENQCNDVRYSQGSYGHKALPLLGPKIHTADGKDGFRFQTYDMPPGAQNRKLLDEKQLTNSDMFIMDYVIPNYDSSVYYIDLDGTFVPEEDGIYDFGLTVQGTGKLFIDGKLIVDNTKDQEPGEAFFGGGTKEKVGSIEMRKGKDYRIQIEFGTAAASAKFGAGGLRIGYAKHVDPTKAIEDAAKLASEVDQVVVFVGLNGDWESESFDRPNMLLPDHTDELIKKVLDANPKAAVVVQSGTPVTMPWVDQASTLVQAWYGGNEAGNGVADVLFGDINPVSIRSLK